jgi:hypothetical protein
MSPLPAGTRADRTSLRQISVFSNPLLLWGVDFDFAFAAALIYVPASGRIFGTAALSPAQPALLAPFPLVVWGSDELRRWIPRKRLMQLPTRTAD